MESVPAQFFLTTLGITFAFGGLLWRDLNDKVKKLQETESSCPIPHVKTDIALIKQDIGWIKDRLKNIR